MSTVHAIVLGLIQGLTEFLPVSSSGHLIFIPKLLGWPDQGVAFDLIMHLGTLTAIIIYFRKKLWQLTRAFFSTDPIRTTDRRFAWLILLSVIPAAAVGLLLETNERNALLVGVDLIIWGVVLGIADFMARARVQNEIIPPTKKQIAAMGCAQAIALLPGTSRSGITMTAGLFAGMSRAQAAEISFLMSVPITALAGLDALYKLAQQHFVGLDGTILAVGFVTAFVSGLLAISGLLKIVQRWSFMPFVIYRISMGILILWWLV
jgi:undecaprenyl-diphosphatase